VHRYHELQRAVPRRTQIRVDRPHQRRARRLEHRHLGLQRGGVELRGEEHYEHDARYDRAREFTQVVLGLWDSWDDDAYVHDKKSGIYFDAGKMHALDHRGEHFKVRGPLNVPRAPQGYPVLVQAGSSEVGRSFAAEFAEVIFTSQLTLAGSQTFCADVRARAEKAGRNPEHIRVMPGLGTMVGASEAEAKEKYEELQSLIDPIVGRELLGMLLGGVDLSPYDIDGPLPHDLPRSQASTSGFDRIVEMARRENLTIRQLYVRSATGRGQRLVVGTPHTIADDIQHWVESGACDGFNIMPTHLPGGLNDFVDRVVPELQRRGIYRKEYEGRTLREHLGLPRPASRYARSG
jgi:FMN-dependent oxidoreductase (nitrilotriacetate monooxygenase family)